MKKCEYCGKEFKIKSYHHKFCSPLCKSRSQGERTNYRSGSYKKCVQCGKEFKSYRKSNRFCSRQCAVLGRNGPKRKQLDSVTFCAYCGKKLIFNKSRIESREHCFCDSKCYGNYKSIDYQGESNPNFKDSPPKICIGCGKEYFSYNKNRKYCSVFCRKGASKSKAIARLRTGLNAERKLAKELRDKNYNVIESKASKGDFDLIAIDKDEILLIQVKVSRSEKSSRIFLRTTINRIEKSIIPKSDKIKKQIWTWVEPQEKWHIKDIS